MYFDICKIISVSWAYQQLILRVIHMQLPYFLPDQKHQEINLEILKTKRAKKVKAKVK